MSTEIVIPNSQDQRVLAAGPGLVLVDAGGGRIEIRNAGGGGFAPDTAAYVTSGAPPAALTNARAITAGANVTLDTTTPGQVIVNAAAGGVTVLSVTKAADTTRTSTVTFAADPELALAAVPAGTYLFFAYLVARCTAGAGGGIKFRFAASAGTINTNTGSRAIGGQSIQLGVTNPGVSCVQSPASGHISTEPSTATSVEFDWSGILITDALANISVEWAPNSNVAVGTTLAINTALRLIKLA